MALAKSATCCEVCGQRVKHGGTKKAVIVGYTIKGIHRVIHARCKKPWEAQRTEIIAKWPELRPDVFATLAKNLQFRIKRVLEEQGFSLTFMLVH